MGFGFYLLVAGGYSTAENVASGLTGAVIGFLAPENMELPTRFFWATGVKAPRRASCLLRGQRVNQPSEAGERRREACMPE